MTRAARSPAVGVLLGSALLAVVLGSRAPRAGAAPPSAPAPVPAPPVRVDDFGHDALDRWKIRNLDASEKSDADAKPAPAQSSEWIELGGASSSDAELSIDAKPVDWRGFDALVVRVGSSAAQPMPMRVMLATGERGALVRRFTVEPGPVRDVVLPLRDFRDTDIPRVGDFGDVRRIVLHLDEAGASDRFPLQFDDLSLRPGTRGPLSCRPTLAQRLAVAFPDGSGVALESEHFVLVTDAEPLKGDDGKRLLARLEEAWLLLTGAFRVPKELPDKAAIYVAATRDGYVELVRRHMKHFLASTRDPASDGFTILRRAFSSYDAKKGWDRPVYVHEATHAALAEALGIASDGNWVQEGMATAVQLRLHPSSARLNRARAFAARAAGEKGPFLPWLDLLSEERPAIPRYAQLSTIFEFLADQHADRLPAIWAAFQSTPGPLNDSRLRPLASVLGLRPQEIEAAWLAWGQSKWQAVPPPASPAPPAGEPAPMGAK
jgi:hypothetical protein